MVLHAPEQGSETTFRIRSHEVDIRRNLKMPALMMLMQEVSMTNANKLNISMWDEDMDNCSWVLLRKEVIATRPILLSEEIRIITYPAGFHRILAYRDFLVYDIKDQLIATASSTWTLMHLEKRKIQRIPPRILSLTPPEQTLPVPQGKLTIDEDYCDAYEYTMRYDDLDWNDHVNNIVFAKLMIQGAPKDFLDHFRLTQYKLHIKSECLFGENIQVTFHRHSETETHHRLVSLQDNRVIATSIGLWAP